MSIEISPVVGTGGERTRGWFFDWSHQWDSLVMPRQNWRDFTLIHLGGEWESYTGRVEATLTVFGLSVTITYVYDDAFNREMDRRVDDIISGRAKTIPFEDAFNPPVSGDQ